MSNHLYNDNNAHPVSENLQEDLRFWQSSMADRHLKMQPRLGIFSTLLAHLNISLYNHEGVVKDFPNGFYTENRIFIPEKTYTDLVNNELTETHYSKNSNAFTPNKQHINMTGPLLIEYLLPLVERKFQTIFDNNDKAAIYQNAFQSFPIYTDSKSQDIIKQVLPETPVFISLKDLVEKLKPLNLDSQEVIESLGSNSDVITHVLFKSKELHNPTHPFNKIADKVGEIKTNLDISKMSREDFAEEYYQYSTTSQINVIFDTLQRIGNNIIQNNPPDNIVTAAKEQWIPFAVMMSENHFAYALKSFKNQLKENLPEADKNSFRESLAHAINQDPYRTELIRDVMIDVLTDFDALNSTNRRKINFR